jgi:hypothetical protein
LENGNGGELDPDRGIRALGWTLFFFLRKPGLYSYIFHEVYIPRHANTPLKKRKITA